MSNLPKNTRGKMKTTAVYGKSVGPLNKRNLAAESRRFTAMSLKASRANRPSGKITSQ